MSTLHASQRFTVPMARVWSAINDHEGMSRWLAAPVKVVAGDGDVGTVRRIGAGFTFDETVTELMPPSGGRAILVYRITRGLPVRHRGEMRVTAVGDSATVLDWEVEITSAIPGFAPALVAFLRPALTRGLRTLAAQLEGSSAPGASAAVPS